MIKRSLTQSIRSRAVEGKYPGASLFRFNSDLSTTSRETVGRKPGLNTRSRSRSPRRFDAFPDEGSSSMYIYLLICLHDALCAIGLEWEVRTSDHLIDPDSSSVSTTFKFSRSKAVTVNCCITRADRCAGAFSVHPCPARCYTPFFSLLFFLIHSI